MVARSFVIFFRSNEGSTMTWIKHASRACLLCPRRRTLMDTRAMSAKCQSEHQPKSCAVHNRKRNRVRGASAAPLCNCRRPPGEPDSLALHDTVIYLTLDRLRRRAAAVIYVPVEIEIISIATVLWQYKVCSAVSFGRIL